MAAPTTPHGVRFDESPEPAAAVRIECNRMSVPLTPRARKNGLSTMPFVHRPAHLVARSSWRMADRSKTNVACLAMCLGSLGWELEQDLEDEAAAAITTQHGAPSSEAAKPRTLQRIYCWRKVRSLAEIPSKAVERVGLALQAQYEKQKARSPLALKLCLNPTVEDLKDALKQSRRAAGPEDKVLFHYNGHGMPRPDRTAFFLHNKNMAVPLSVEDTLHYLGYPHIIVMDCASAGTVLARILSLIRKEEESSGQRYRPPGSATSHGGDLSTAPTTRHDTYFLGACADGEALPTHPLLPNDIFTSCLTTPIETAVLWFCIQHRRFVDLPPYLVHLMPGSVDDRKTLLGELKWIFSSITDCIAWSLVSEDLFFRLFRQDALLVSLFRNFMLAERIITSLGCHPVSYPVLPRTALHPLWESWDCAVESAVVALLRACRPAPTKSISAHDLRSMIDEQESRMRYADTLSSTNLAKLPFFDDELCSFHSMIDELQLSKDTPHVMRLPMLMQILLSVGHRVRGLWLVCRFVDLGAWAVDQCEQIRLYTEVLNRLWTKSDIVELHDLMSFCWAKSTYVDHQLIPVERRGEALQFLVAVLHEPSAVTGAPMLGVYSQPIGQRLMAACTITVLLHESGNPPNLVILPEVVVFLLKTASEQLIVLADSVATEAVRFKVVLATMITCLMFFGNQVVLDAVSETAAAIVSLVVQDRSPSVRFACARVLHSFVVASEVVGEEFADAVMRVMLEAGRTECNYEVKREFLSASRTYCSKHASRLKKVPSKDLMEALSPANKRPSVNMASATPHISSTLPMSEIGHSLRDDYDSASEVNSPTVQSPRSPPPFPMAAPAAPIPGGLCRRVSGEMPVIVQQKLDALRVAVTHAAKQMPLAAPAATELMVPIATVHALAAATCESHPKLRAIALKILTTLSGEGCIPPTRFRRDDPTVNDFTPKQSLLNRVGNFFSRAPPAAGAGSNRGPSSLNMKPTTDFDESDDLIEATFSEFNLTDPTTISDSVYEMISFLQEPLLDPPDDDDPRQPALVARAHKVDVYSQTVMKHLSTTLAPGASRVLPVQRPTIEFDAKACVFHPTEPHLVAAGSQDLIGVWNTEEKDVKPVHVFRLSTIVARSMHHAMSGVGTGFSNSSIGEIPPTPKSTASFSKAMAASVAGNLAAQTKPASQLTALHIIDPAVDPLLLTVACDGVVSILTNYMTPDLVQCTCTFRTMPFEASLASHWCAAQYQPLLQRICVTGASGTVSTWDLHCEMMVDERRELDSNATCVSCSFEDPFLFVAGYNSGTVVLFDVRLPRGSVGKCEGMRSSCMAVAYNRCNPNIFTGMSAIGIVATWDERKMTHSPPSPSHGIRGQCVDSYSVNTHSAVHVKGDQLGVDSVTAVDIHSCFVREPLLVYGTTTRAKIASRGHNICKFKIRNPVTCCAWHPLKLTCAISYYNKVSILDHPAAETLELLQGLVEL